MGNLTDDLTRLRAEITTLRDNRSALRTALTRNILQLKGDVEDLRSGFRQAHADMANAGRKRRVDFVTDLSQQVAGLLGAVAADLKGARDAWAGEIRTGKSVLGARNVVVTATIRGEPATIKPSVSDAHEDHLVVLETTSLEPAAVPQSELPATGQVETDGVNRLGPTAKKQKQSPGRRSKKH